MRTKVPTDDISIDSLLAYYYKYVANLGESAKELLIDKETGKLNVITSYNRMHGYHAQTLKTLEERLNSGWSSIEILGRLQDAKCGGVKAQSIGEIIPSKKPVANRADEELLDPDYKYRHPELRKVEPPAFKDATMVKSARFLRRKSYTLGNLAEYYRKQLKPDVSDDRLRGVLKSILNNNAHLDDVLTAIDLWASDTSLYSVDNAYNLERYIKQAKAMREFLDTQEAANVK